MNLLPYWDEITWIPSPFPDWLVRSPTSVSFNFTTPPTFTYYQPRPVTMPAGRLPHACSYSQLCLQSSWSGRKLPTAVCRLCGSPLQLRILLTDMSDGGYSAQSLHSAEVTGSSSSALLSGLSGRRRNWQKCLRTAAHAPDEDSILGMLKIIRCKIFTFTKSE